MSDQDTTTTEPTTETVEETPQAPSWTPDSDYAKQFPGGPDELWKGYTELREKLSSTRPEPQQAEPEPEVSDPLDFLPPHVDEQLWMQIATYANSPRGGPEKAVRQVWENKDYWGDEVCNALLKNWEGVDYMGAQRFLQEQFWSEREAQLNQHWQQRMAPLEQRQREEVAQSMESILKQAWPEIATKQWGEKISQWLEQNRHDPLWDPQMHMNANAAAERVMDIAATIMRRESPDRFRTPPPEPVADGEPAPDPREKARTTNRSTAPRSSNTKQDGVRKQFRATLGIAEDAHPS